MQKAFTITDSELENLADGSIFSMMLNTEATLVSATEVNKEDHSNGFKLPIDTNETLIAGTVRFVGNLTGVIHVFMDLPMALKFTSRLLSMSRDEIEAEGHETVNDAIGELTNMIVGSFKNDLSNKGLQCQMTIPSILRGSNYTVEPAEGALRRIFKFDCEGSSFLIDALIKEEPTF